MKPARNQNEGSCGTEQKNSAALPHSRFADHGMTP